VNLLQHLYRLGGVADRRILIDLTGRADVDRALREGEIVRDGRGRYAVPVADAGLRAANALSGVASHRTAAIHWGWEVKTVPEEPDVTVPRNRKVPAERRKGIDVHWEPLPPEDIVGGRVTSPRRTLTDCMRSLPFDEALAVADSALRHGSLSKATLVDLAEAVRGTGAPQCRRVAREASGDAANPFESVLRAISLDVPDIDLVPQVPISERNFSVCPDLVDLRRRVVAEADSLEWHGNRAALRIDCQRYNNLVVRGWHVLRFAWEDVMHDPASVRRTLSMMAALVHERAGSAGPADPAA
jgi:very-short-patch-repair endonuclease